MSWQQNEKKEKYLYSFQNKPFCVLYMIRIRLLKVDGYAVFLRCSHGPTD